MRETILNLCAARYGEGDVTQKMQALMERCKLLSDRRNAVIHGLFGRELDGGVVVSTDDGTWADAPTLGDLHAAAAQLEALKDELVTERIEGFLADAASPMP